MPTIPDQFQEIAKSHAIRRAAMNKDIREQSKFYYVPEPELVDFIGVLGEMLAAFELMKKGKAFFLNHLFDVRQVHEPDLIFKLDDITYRVDVKTTIKNHCCVPVHKLKKAQNHNITHYWFINLNLGASTYKQKFFSLEQVKSWSTEETYSYKSYLLRL